MESKNTYFRGLIFTRIEDYGPDVTNNFSNLDETQVLALVVQAFTLIGVGTGTSRSTLSKESYLYGPMPVSNLLLNSLVFPFIIDDQTSKDERIRKAGRSCAFIVLVSRRLKHYDKLREILSSFLSEWTNNSKLNESSIKSLLAKVEGLELFKINSNEYNYSTEFQGSDNELKDVINKQTTKIRILEHLLNMDSFSKALMSMYESNPNGGSIDQLAKMAGMSRIMIGWNLRKYVKAGILKLEKNQIQFLN